MAVDVMAVYIVIPIEPRGRGRRGIPVPRRNFRRGPIVDGARYGEVPLRSSEVSSPTIENYSSMRCSLASGNDIR